MVVHGSFLPERCGAYLTFAKVTAQGLGLLCVISLFMHPFYGMPPLSKEGHNVFLVVCRLSLYIFVSFSVTKMSLRGSDIGTKYT